MTEPRDPTARLDALETRIAYQDETIEDLNRVVTRHWQQIERLTRELELLSERLRTAEAGLGDPEGEEPPPPHY